MKAMIILVIAALSLAASAASTQAHPYRAPDQNFHQNNWMAGGG
jgi:hypothetical protein